MAKKDKDQGNDKGKEELTIEDLDALDEYLKDREVDDTDIEKSLEDRPEPRSE